MSRPWPTADTACSVGRSVGRAPPRPSGGRPAAMAPDVTMIALWPCPRRPATSAQSFSMAWTSISPRSSVSDDVPIFTTTIMGASTRLVLEGEAADVDHVAFPRSCTGEGAVDPQPLEPTLHVGEGLGVGDVAHGHRPLGGPAPDDEGAVVAPFDHEAFGLGAVDDEPLGEGHGAAGLV